jgi:hypothetical protein
MRWREPSGMKSPLIRKGNPRFTSVGRYAKTLVSLLGKILPSEKTVANLIDEN